MKTIRTTGAPFCTLWNSTVNLIPVSKNQWRLLVIENKAFLDTLAPEETAAQIQKASCSVFSNSDEAWNLAQSWVRECVQSHTACARSIHSSSLPTRLIDVGTSAGIELPRLVSTVDDAISGPYLALSYCWGSVSGVKLTNSTLHEFKRGLLIINLPKTIQDALHIVRRLNYRYLWVDSLCVIQDSAVDWETEAASMGAIYRNASLTIAALGASSSDQGLFSQRDPLLYHPCWMFKSRDGKDFYAGSTTIPREWFEDAPLHQRGWVLQERLLSPRTLNFGSLLAWECRECFLAEFNFEKKDTAKNLFQDLKPASPDNVSLDEDARLALLEIWHRKVLHSYSYADLTFKTDRMVAIAGIIDDFSERTGWENIRGLWKPYLEYELLWSADRTMRGARIPNEALTWSWGSIDTGIWHPTIDYHIYSQCQRNLLANATVVQNIEQANRPGGSMTKSEINVHGITFELMMDQAARKTRRPSVVNVDGIPPGSSSVRFRADVFPMIQGPYCFLPILELLDLSRIEEIGPTIYGIAIAKLSAVPCIYERVGFVEYDLPRGQHFDKQERKEATIVLV